MAKRLYVGNLPYSTTEEDIRPLFEQHGDVHSIEVILDRYTGRSRGFCFVEMENADAAIENVNGLSLEGRTLTVNEARQREQRSFGSNRGGGPRW